jgi:hypothetical protein
MRLAGKVSKSDGEISGRTGTRSRTLLWGQQIWILARVPELDDYEILKACCTPQGFQADHACSRSRRLTRTLWKNFMGNK